MISFVLTLFYFIFLPEFECGSLVIDDAVMLQLYNKIIASVSLHFVDLEPEV